jgi:hypothetical protein
MSKQYKIIFLSIKCTFVAVTKEYGCQDEKNKERKIRDIVSTLLIADSHPRNIKIRYKSILKNQIGSFDPTRLYIGKEISCINIYSRSLSGGTGGTVGTNGNSFQT